MNILLDKLAAAIIAATIFLMVFNVNIRNEQTMAEAASFYTMTRQSEEFAKILRRDLQGVESVITVVEEPDGEEEGGTVFRFTTRIGEDATLRTITYRKIPVGERAEVPYYRIERLVDGVASGGSSDVLIDWSIEALNEDAAPILDPDNAAQVRVRFEAAPFLQESEVVQSIKWESRFFPPLRN